MLTSPLTKKSTGAEWLLSMLETEQLERKNDKLVKIVDEHGEEQDEILDNDAKKNNDTMDIQDIENIKFMDKDAIGLVKLTSTEVENVKATKVENNQPIAVIKLGVTAVENIEATNME